MSSEPETPSPPAARDTAPGASLHDLMLQLNFVPKWAQQPVADSPYRGRGDEVRDRAPRRDDRDRDRGRGGDRDRNRSGGRPGGGGFGQRGRGPRDRDRGPMRRDRDQPPPVLRLPVEIAFVPEREKLGQVVRSLNDTQRAFALTHLASVFLSSPDHHLVKIEIRENEKQNAQARLHQCARCQAVFVDDRGLRTHLLARHVGDFFEEQEKQVEPPAGNFVGVGRCRLSGILLGPPNYHGYNEKLLELHRTRFHTMPLDEYRKQIDLVRDPALVEQWKEQSRTRKTYRVKDAGAEAAELTRQEAEHQFLQKHAAGLMKSGYRFVIPARAVEQMTDEALRRPIHEAWLREQRFPFKLMMALRPAFKRMHLHLFKAGGRETFVTAVPPNPLESGHVVENIRQMIQLLWEHPGWTHQQLLDQLAPGTALDSPEAAHLLGPLRWLVEKGHVIEFFDGTLAVLGTAPARAPAAAPVAVEPEPTSPTLAAEPASGVAQPAVESPEAGGA